MVCAAPADDLTGQASIIDGDTLEIHGTRIRLWGIGAPESSQLCRARIWVGSYVEPWLFSGLHQVWRQAE
jgi:endonuclease YncB( thermonuclease family)